MYEAVSGARMHAAYFRPGGVYRDLPDSMPQYQASMDVLTSRLVGGLPQISVFADSQPEEGFVSVEPDLEDVFVSLTSDSPEKPG